MTAARAPTPKSHGRQITDLQAEGFVGFVTIADLGSTLDAVPDAPGVYQVIYERQTEPQFLTVGTGGHFKGQDPNVAIAELRAKWILGSAVVYIGKATSLRRRIRELLRFGAGRRVAHRGGRYLWQIKEASSLKICWMPCAQPRTVEKEMIQRFVDRYGKRPFANLVG